MDKQVLKVFPYYKDFQGNFYPIIPLVLFNKSKRLDTDALVDSGASISIFQPAIAELLGIKILSGKEIYLGGVGGRIKGYIHSLKIAVASKNFVCPIVFSFEYHVSVNLLGRDSVFEKFRIIFEEKHRKISFD